MSLPKRALLLFVLGFFLGPIGDWGHVVSGTTGYPPKVFGLYFFGLPFWVPLLFGSATVAIGLTHPFFDRFLGKLPERPGVRGIPLASLGVAFFLGLYLLSGFLPWPTGNLTDVVLMFLAGLIWIFLDRSWQGLVLGALTAATGTGVEILLVHVGAFFYVFPKDNFNGVASWLPWVYFAASVTVGNLGRVLKS